ncbi:NUDIX domain-containing protein [Archangium violaceum]|uniref:NUDIX domain-containing protein n=1 Tax=Archangium violaceum TaxID=83451 RepID=UPI0036D7639F
MKDRFLCVTCRGQWQQIGLPAGKVEPGETVERAAGRELMEETGVRALELRRVFVRRWADCVVETFLAVKWEGRPRSVE